MRPINVISLFDGKACARVALERAGIPVGNYYASEIDKYAMLIAKKNYPDIQHVGDVTKLQHVDWTGIDLLCGGSPCQGFSFAGKQLNFNDPRSALFFEFVRIWNEIKAVNPNAKFFLENVKMKKEHQEVISKLLGVEPVFVCSSLLSGNKRKRLYWTNIDGFKMPLDKGLALGDFISKEGDFKYLNDKEIIRAIQNHSAKTWKSGNKMGAVRFPTDIKGKGKCLTTVRIKGDRSQNHIDDTFGIRLLSILEYERLQTLPDNYTQGVSDSQRYKMIGNGWTIDVIVEFFKHLKPDTDFSENLDF